MSHTVEEVSIWILEALEDEWRREPDILKCRTEAIVLGEVMAKHNLENDEITRARMFMAAPDRQYITVMARNDGQVILATDYGLAMLAKIKMVRIDEAKAEAAAQKADVERKQDVRLKMYAIIVSILGLLIAYLAYKLWK